MSVETVKTLVPPPVNEPRAARWAAAGAAALSRLFGTARGHADLLRQRFDRWCCPPPRTRGDILALARQVESDQPSLAAELRWIAWHRPSDISAP